MIASSLTQMTLTCSAYLPKDYTFLLCPLKNNSKWLTACLIWNVGAFLQMHLWFTSTTWSWHFSDVVEVPQYQFSLFIGGET